MTDAIDKSKEAIAKVLVENNVLSQAQVDLAYMDMDIQDLPFEEVLYMRGWLTQDKLYELAPFLKPGYKPPPKQAEKKEPVQKKIPPKAKPAQDEAPLVIALGAPKEEAAETPVIALGAPAKEEQAEESPVIALGAPAKEKEEAEEEKQLETPVIAAPPEEKTADEAPAKVIAVAKEDTADSLFSMDSPKQAVAESDESLFGSPDNESVDSLFASLKPAAKAKDDAQPEIKFEKEETPSASSINEEEEAVAGKMTEKAPVSANAAAAEGKEAVDSQAKASEPKGIASVSSARTEESVEDKASDTAGGGSAKSKPTDIPGEPPIRSAERPAVIQSPVEKSKEQSLKAYKEILRKILTVEKK